MSVGVVVTGGDMKKAVYDTLNHDKVNAVDIAAIIANTILKKAGSTLRNGVNDASDETQHQLNSTWTVVKTFTFTNGIKGTLTFKEEIKADNGSSYPFKCRWYHGAVAIGTEQSNGLNDTYQSKSEDIAVNIAVGEALILKVWCQFGVSYPLNYVKNMHLCYDNDFDAVAVT